MTGAARGHSVFTIVVPVASDHPALDDALGEIGADPAANEVLPFATVAGLHFASATVIDGSPDGEIGASLVIELNSDLPIDDAIAGLLAKTPAGIEALLADVPGWPGAVDPDAASFLRARVHTPGAYHVGNTARRLDQIVLEAALWDHIQAVLDERAQARTLPTDPAEVWELVRASVAADPRVAPALDPPAASETVQSSGSTGFVNLARNLVMHAPGALLALIARFPWLLVRECLEAPDDSLADPVDLAWLESTEDRPPSVQNHLTSVVTVKQGLRGGRSRFRLHVLRRVFEAIEVLARNVYDGGELGGITSIHFAHWSIIDGGRRLLFVSNFDGSWESYLDDFIELAHLGLTGVWSNAEGFPRTHLLVRDGATHGEQFKRWARRSQQVTPVWYSAYPRLGVSQIDTNSRVRNGLATRPTSGEEMRVWLERL